LALFAYCPYTAKPNKPYGRITPSKGKEGMEKKPIVISRVEIKEVVDLGFTVSKEKGKSIRRKRDYTLLRIEEGIAEHRGRPHTVITSKSPRH
jgi:hypothetical protein